MTSPSFRLDPPELPPPPAQEQARKAATRALQILAADVQAADGPAVYAANELNTALDPLRLHPALGVRCSKCEHGLGFVAVEPESARMMSGNRLQPPHLRRGGIYDLADKTPHKGRYEGWIQDAEDQKGSVTPTGEAPGQRTGLPQRRTYHCRGCGADYTVKNSRILALYLAAIARGDHEIRLR